MWRGQHFISSSRSISDEKTTTELNDQNLPQTAAGFERTKEREIKLPATSARWGGPK